MIIGCVQWNNNRTVSFKEKLSPEARRAINKVLTPLVDNFTPLGDIAKQTVYTKEQINRWSLHKYGMTVTNLYKKILNEKLEKEFIEHKKNKTPLKEMEKIYGHNGTWINKRYRELGMYTIKEERNKLIVDNVRWMIEAGYTLRMMKDNLKVSIDTLQKWISKTLGCSLNEYRRAHNIKRKYNK